ncbi:uncharacterized protein EV154DRAFT_484931 [Mucor mucedo]|uniref:uncharacterized protein n=1 Tax=Mucor mucedo TaxID=29922 RepID=UPI00221E74D5|nr:uncharacterized protein EV154DRAFT_484931 [Mucor mucedo]KAI7887628.1 hypothetical protein EV154DRAFT_484931 [Mucor mucedo]
MPDLISTFCFFFRGFAVFFITPIISDLVSLALVCPITPTVLLVANKNLLKQPTAIAHNSELSFGDPFPKVKRLNSQVTTGQPSGSLQIILRAFEKPLLYPEMAKAEGLCCVKTLDCLS